MKTLPDRLSHHEQTLLGNLKNPDKAFWDALCMETEKSLSDALSSADGAVADRAWFLNRVAQCYRGFVTCFEQMRTGAFYEAWCEFERIEIALPWLVANPFLNPKDFAIGALKKRVTQWQSLYPYKVFISPGMIHRRKECSLCHAVISPWNSCAHEVGKVYDGRECYRIVTKAEFLEVSLVLDPVQKYSVAFAAKGPDGKAVDHHDHSVARFLVDRLASPFDDWLVQRTFAYHPHSLFPNATEEGPCPCESGRSYKGCCLSRRGVVRPHFQFAFKKPPAQSLPSAAFAGYGERNGPADIRESDALMAK